jgi:5-methylcytosine-specific restriction endonuclease McrA
MPVPKGTRTLVLNDDFGPLNCTTWQGAFKKIFSDSTCEHCRGKCKFFDVICPYCNGMGVVPQCSVVEYYDIWIRDSRNREYPVPAVILNQHHVKHVYRKPNFSKLNVFRRDNFTCQYCGLRLSPKELTVDHVIPRSRWKESGSPSCFENTCCACWTCNKRKGARTPNGAKMPLLRIVDGRRVYYNSPTAPTASQIVLGLSGQPIPEEWKPYLKVITK